MTTDQLYEKLNVMSASRLHRSQNAEMVINHPELVPQVLDILFMVDDEVSCKAAWVLEFACSNQLEIIFPHLDRFVDNIHKVHLDSTVRPVAKICELLTVAYYSKNENPIQSLLKPLHKEKIVETCFDWMINDEKVAPKAYSMNSLYLLGQDFDWIHPELAMILERDFHKESAGFRARAKHILKKIRRH